MYDTIIRNGTIIDGTGADRYVADIALKDDDALEIQDQLNDMGVSIEGIGDPDGVPVNGYKKIMFCF